MGVCASFAGKFDIAKRADATILLSPVSTFSLPFPIKISPFVPPIVLTFFIRFLAEKIVHMVAPGEDSEFSRQEALRRARAMDPKQAIEQAKDLFYKEDVSNFWKTVKVPSLIFVGEHDPLVKLEHSFDAFQKLPYPIWYKLEAPDHLLLESNMHHLKNTIPKFAKDPWKFYEEHQHLSPNIE